MLIKTTIISLVLVSLQSSAIVVKDNGDELKIIKVELIQGSKQSGSSSLSYFINEVEKSVDISEVKRINLKELSSRKKGLAIWEALLIMKDNKKIEIRIPLNKIRGTDESGNKIEISSGTIDKISF